MVMNGDVSMAASPGAWPDGCRKAELVAAILAEPSTAERTKRHLAAFEDRFGPAALAGLDGEALLRRMHGRQDEDTHQSMVYWLEFKNDEEFSGLPFGGIGGGNSSKFGIYQRNADGAWVIGWPGNANVVTITEAIAKARQQRDELLAGSVVLAKMAPADASDAVYASLQLEMAAAAPALHGDGWAHKWWFLVHLDRLDGYHTPRLQRFHLLKLLQSPPGSEGTLVGPGASRFTCAGRFVALAREFDVPMPTLMTVLNRRHGSFHRYWRVGTRDGESKGDQWPFMHVGGFASIGWKAQVPDMSEAVRGTAAEVREWVRGKLDGSGLYAKPTQAGTLTRKAGELANFAHTMAEGEIVLACEGQTVLGIGRVSGGYEYNEALTFPHTRPVEWLSLGNWVLPEIEGLHTSCVELGRHAANILEIERRLQGSTPPAADEARAARKSPLAALDLIVARIEQVLDRKGQVLLYGPPGTGKTFWAVKAARELAARRAFGKAHSQLSVDERAKVEGQDGLVRICTFHPGYGYEDFMEGLRPEASSVGHLVFTPRDGTFKRLCADAAREPGRLFFLIVDEFNRGDVPRIFGELLTVIELDKRGTDVLLPITGKPFAVPPNVHVIGTMNTADRSISLLDAALRRRFGFIEMMPDSGVLRGRVVGGLPLGPWLDALNARLRKHLKRDARHLQVGHAYLMPHQPITSVAELARVLRYDLVPLLEEYCFDDLATLQAILGKDLVDIDAGRIRDELFDAPGSGAFLDAIRFEEMSGYQQAAGADEAADTDEPELTESEATGG